MTAAQDTLDTAELLEMILTKVDMRTLLIAQRVNRVWSNSIRGSTKLQKKLFLTPATTKDIIKLDMATHVAERSQSTFIACEMIIRTSDGPQAVSPSNYSILNPLFDWRFQYRAPQCTKPREAARVPGQRPIAPSWRRMLLTQPPQFELWMQNSSDSAYLIGAELPGDAPARKVFQTTKTVRITLSTKHYQQWLDAGRPGQAPSGPAVSTFADFWQVVEKEHSLMSSEERGDVDSVVR